MKKAVLHKKQNELRAHTKEVERELKAAGALSESERLEVDVKITKLDPVTALFETGGLVHVYAGRDGICVQPEEGESVLDWIARAQQMSADGDVWLVPHWC